MSRRPDQVRTFKKRNSQSLLPSPSLNQQMMPRQQHFRNRKPCPDFRARVMRAVQQTIKFRIKTVLLVAFSGIQYARLQPSDGIEQSHGHNFATRQYKITQTDLLRDT